MLQWKTNCIASYRTTLVLKARTSTALCGAGARSSPRVRSGTLTARYRATAKPPAAVPEPSPTGSDDRAAFLCGPQRPRLPRRKAKPPFLSGGHPRGFDPPAPVSPHLSHRLFVFSTPRFPSGARRRPRPQAQRRGAAPQLAPPAAAAAPGPRLPPAPSAPRGPGQTLGSRPRAPCHPHQFLCGAGANQPPPRIAARAAPACKARRHSPGRAPVRALR